VDKNNDVPKISYNIVKINEIVNVADKDRIDILVIVTNVGDCATQNLRSGRSTKKREIQVIDDSGADIMLTFWGENSDYKVDCSGTSC
jgi:replication factor A1